MSDVRHGLALLLDTNGKIERVLQNDLGLTEAVPGNMLVRLADRGSRSRALEFVTRITNSGTALNSEWNVLSGDIPTTLYFSGAQVDDRIVVVAAASDKETTQLYKEFVRISNEQTNLLRDAMKLKAQQVGLQLDLYDEVSRLNNDLVTMQREVARKNIELEHLNHEKNRFLSIAAHDIRNPLQVILMQSEFLLDNSIDFLPPEQRDFLQDICNASQFVVNLVDDLLDVAKIEAQQLTLNLEATDLPALLTHNLAQHRLLAGSKQVRIEEHLSPLPTAMVDPARIEQLLNNLISNAVKFSEPDSRVKVGLEPIDHSFQLTVSDQGPGLSPEIQNNIFKPFPRGRQRGTANESSNGLGLMIVKHIVDSHHGQIAFDTIAGQGTTFYISIPLQPPEQPV
jgi:signal transduction histidine kinase